MHHTPTIFVDTHRDNQPGRNFIREMYYGCARFPNPKAFAEHTTMILTDDPLRRDSLIKAYRQAYGEVGLQGSIRRLTEHATSIDQLADQIPVAAIGERFSVALFPPHPYNPRGGQAILTSAAYLVGIKHGRNSLSQEQLPLAGLDSQGSFRQCWLALVESLPGCNVAVRVGARLALNENGPELDRFARNPFAPFQEANNQELLMREYIGQLCEVGARLFEW